MTYLPRQVLESIHLGILVFGPDGRLVHMNPAAEEILRASAGSLLGRSFRTVLSASPGAATVVEQTLSEGKAVTAFDVRLALPSPTREGEGGQDVPAIAGSSPLVSPHGTPSGAVLYLKPVEILSMVEREEEAMRSAAETEMLAYGLAHEIKNPLGGILGASQWILREEATEGERAEGIRLVLREARRINDLVEKMLDLGRTPPPRGRTTSFRSSGRRWSSPTPRRRGRERASPSISPSIRASPPPWGTRRRSTGSW